VVILERERIGHPYCDRLLGCGELRSFSGGQGIHVLQDEKRCARAAMPTHREREPNELLSVESTLTSRGQTTIPGPIRRALKLRPTDKVRFSLRADDTVVITRVSTEQRDPMVAAFLDFIEADARQHPQRVRAVPVDVIDRARELSADVVVDLDAPLDADEG
jgi:antitoxin PrlF